MKPLFPVNNDNRIMQAASLGYVMPRLTPECGRQGQARRDRALRNRVVSVFHGG